MKTIKFNHIVAPKDSSFTPHTPDTMMASGLANARQAIEEKAKFVPEDRFLIVLDNGNTILPRTQEKFDELLYKYATRLRRAVMYNHK